MFSRRSSLLVGWESRGLVIAVVLGILNWFRLGLWLSFISSFSSLGRVVDMDLGTLLGREDSAVGTVSGTDLGTGSGKGSVGHTDLVARMDFVAGTDFVADMGSGKAFGEGRD